MRSFGLLESCKLEDDFLATPFPFWKASICGCPSYLAVSLPLRKSLRVSCGSYQDGLVGSPARRRRTSGRSCWSTVLALGMVSGMLRVELRLMTRSLARQHSGKFSRSFL